MAKPRSVREQLADERAHSARLERALRHRAPGTTRTGTPTWQVIEQLCDWLTELDTLDWPLSGQGPQTGTIGRSGHSDPTGEAAANREQGWSPSREATRLLDRVQRCIAESRKDTKGAPMTPRTRLRTADCCSNDHAHTWRVCPWTGNMLASLETVTPAP